MQAYLNNPVLKRAMVKEIKEHQRLDQIIQGTYGAYYGGRWQGCAVGCALHSLNKIQGASDDNAVEANTSLHDRFPAELGIPLELAYHIDHVFENLPAKKAKRWPLQVTTAIKTGADLSSVIPALLQWMILDPADGLMATLKPRNSRERQIVRRFARLVKQDWAGETVTGAEWDEINTALETVGAWARARAWAGAWAGAWAWAGARAWAGAYPRLAQKTLELIRACDEP